MTIPPIVDEFEDEEVFVIPVPQDAEDGDDLVFPLLSEDEAHAILNEDL